MYHPIQLDPMLNNSCIDCVNESLHTCAAVIFWCFFLKKMEVLLRNISRKHYILKILFICHVRDTFLLTSFKGEERESTFYSRFHDSVCICHSLQSKSHMDGVSWEEIRRKNQSGAVKKQEYIFYSHKQNEIHQNKIKKSLSVTAPLIHTMQADSCLKMRQGNSDSIIRDSILLSGAKGKLIALIE